MSAVIDFNRKTKRMDWLRSDFADTAPAMLEAFHERKCPPCDRLCAQGRDCPRDNDLPVSKRTEALYWVGALVGFAVFCGLVAALVSVVLGW